MDKKTRSYLIYFGIAMLCFLIADRAEKKNNKKLVFFIATILSVISGLRKNTVGVDTNTYYWIFNSLNSISDCLTYNDRIFYIIAYMVKKISNNVYTPFFVFSLISNFCVIYRLWDYRNISSYKYSILRYITIFYFFSFNCMRQFVSISIVFFATKFLDEKKYGKFIIYVLLASTIHISALLSVIFIFLEYLKKENLNTKQRNIVSLSVLIIPIYLFFALNSTSNRYERYMNTIDIFDWKSLAAKFILLVIVVFIFYHDKNNMLKNKNILLIFIYYLIGLGANLLGIFYRYMERTGYYFYIYATVYTGIVAKYRKYLWLFRLIALVILIRTFVINCTTNSMGQMPYLFNWE